jgi:hypothetical protein
MRFTGLDLKVEILLNQLMIEAYNLDNIYDMSVKVKNGKKKSDITVKLNEMVQQKR